ncbi:MAG TPA: hypothetical protein VEU72_09245 [Nitrosopumilaceae archaeon]|nr:hypothetical protein [Nitrosopumilaceae archaeon]
MKIIIALIGLLISSTFLFTGTFAQTTNLPNNFETIVYQSNNYYYVTDSQNNIITSSGVPEFVIKTALERGGDIYIAEGTYNLSSNFSGFDLKSNTYLRLAHNAYIVVPSGYGGHVFRFNSATFQSVIDGGNINEAFPVTRNWIGILMQGEAVSFNLVENMVITNPFIVIDFNTSSPNYISANTFYNINGNSFVRGIEFDFTGKYIPWRTGFFGNTFRDLQFQGGSMTTYGVKDMEHYWEAFYNVIFWDLPSNAISANIDPLASYNIIIGGQMTRPNFDDKGKNTVILDTYTTKNTSNSTILLEILNGTYHPQMNVPTLRSNQVLNMSIITQSANGFVNGNQGQLSVSVGKSITVNIFGKVTNPKGGSVLLSIIRPDGFVEQNQADVTSAGSFYYPMIFDKDSLTGQYQISGSYQNSNLGDLLLNVTSGRIQLPNENHSNINIATPSESNTTLSTSIKISAKLWSHGQIRDSIFGDSIHYLIKNGIVELPYQDQTSTHQSTYIPSWFKNNAGWWADGQISVNDFISELQYLLNSKIMIIS